MSAPAGSGPRRARPVEAVDEGPDAWATSSTRLERLRTRLAGNPQLVVGLLLLVGFLAAGVSAWLHFGGHLTGLYRIPAYEGVSAPPGPSLAHPFGVMGNLGVDELTALWQATPLDLVLIGATVGLSASMGVLLGSYAGLAGGAVDVAITEVSDLLVGVPPFFFVMVLFLGLERFLRSPLYLPVFVLLFAFVLFPYHARPVRARALEVAGEPYVESARAAGAGTRRLLFRHVLPNSTAPVLAQLPIDVYNFLFVLTVFPFLSCLGGGTGNALFSLITPLPSPTFPEWGFLLAQGACAGWSPLASLDYPWMYAFPAAVIVLFGLSVTLAADGLERYLAGRVAAT